MYLFFMFLLLMFANLDNNNIVEPRYKELGYNKTLL